jgi:hypothetical protein
LEKRLPFCRKTTPKQGGRWRDAVLTAIRPHTDVKLLRRGFGSCFLNSATTFGSWCGNVKKILQNIKCPSDKWKEVPPNLFHSW